MQAPQHEEIDRLRRCLDGDAASWEELLLEHHSFVASIVKRILARRGLPDGPQEVEEATADFFGDLCLRREQTLGGYRREGSFRAYLAVLAANHARRRARSWQREREEIGEYAQAVEERGGSGGPEPSDPAHEDLPAALERCTAQERLLFQLLYVDGLPVERACSFLGVTRDVLYLRKHRFHAKVRSILDERSRARAGSRSG